VSSHTSSVPALRVRYLPLLWAYFSWLLLLLGMSMLGRVLVSSVDSA